MNAPREVVVLARSEHFVVVDKPAGVPTEPAPGHATSLRDLVRGRHGPPHAVSRLDVNVTGCVLFALTERARRASASARKTDHAKRYLALVEAAPKDVEAAFTTPIDGRPAHTVLAACAASARGPALLTLAPVTGRTHQLRLHTSRAGAPILGDGKHGGARSITLEDGAVLPVPRVMLHAYELAFAGPFVELGLPARVVAPLPEDLRVLLDALGLDRAHA